MKLPRRSRRPKPASAPYAVRPPYAEARARLLSRRPNPGDETVRPSARVFAAVADVALDTYLVSVYLFADGTVSIYSTEGIHSTGLRGAPKVAVVAAGILEDVEASIGEFSVVDDLAALPLPERGESQILARTYDGDFAASERLGSKHGTVVQLAAQAFLLTQLARAAIIEGFDRVEEGEVEYAVAPEYRRIRQALMDWLPEQLPASARVASVAVEFGEADAQTVTSLFAFADGSTSVYRSDGTRVEGLSGAHGMVDAAHALLDSTTAALSEFGPAGLISLPQPGRVQFFVRARLGHEGEWTELLATASAADLAEGSHPLSPAFARANEILRIAG